MSFLLLHISQFIQGSYFLWGNVSMLTFSIEKNTQPDQKKTTALFINIILMKARYIFVVIKILPWRLTLIVLSLHPVILPKTAKFIKRQKTFCIAFQIKASVRAFLFWNCLQWILRSAKACFQKAYFFWNKIESSSTLFWYEFHLGSFDINPSIIYHFSWHCQIFSNHELFVSLSRKKAIQE